MISPSHRSALWVWHVLFGLHIAYNSDATRCKRTNSFTLCVCVCVSASVVLLCVVCLSVCFQSSHHTDKQQITKWNKTLFNNSDNPLPLSHSLSHTCSHTRTHTNPFKSPCVWISLTGGCSFCLVLSFIHSHTLRWNQKQGRRAFGSVCVHLQSVLPSILDTTSLNSSLKLLRESQHGHFFFV